MRFLARICFTFIPCTAAFMLGLSNGDVKAQTRLYSSITERQAFRLVVTYEGQRCELDVFQDETILAALERNSIMDTLCLTAIPSDCRRGNCMTCAGRVVEINNPTSTTTNIRRGEDGLAPHVSDILQSSNYVLTCSSFIEGDGVEIALGEHNRIWEEMYQSRFVSEDSRRTSLETVAKLFRLRAESNVSRWASETEKILRGSGDIESSDIF